MIGSPQERLAELDNMYPEWPGYTQWTMFLKNSRLYSTREFYNVDGDSVTYQQAHELIDKLAAGLYAIGIRPTDHVSVCLDNGPELIQLIYALAKLGAVRVSVHFKAGLVETIHILKTSDSNFFIIGKSYDLEEIHNNVPTIKKVIALQNIMPVALQNNYLMGWQDVIKAGKTISEEDINLLIPFHKTQRVCQILCLHPAVLQILRVS